MVATQFRPKVHETCQLLGEMYVVQPHPASPTRVYAQMGGRGRVFQLKHQRDGQLWALKVFHPRYRVASLVTTAQQLSSVASYEGLRAANRRIVQASDPIVSTHPDLAYAMIMPWIKGKTWYDFLVNAASSGRPFSLAISLQLCKRFLEVLASLEQSGMAHTDLSPGNVVLELNSCDVQLLDLEDLYMPGAVNSRVATGSNGYRHSSGDAGTNLWRAEGDRYAAAVLAAEILILANNGLARRATDEGFFTNHHLSKQGGNRFVEAKAWLFKVAPTFASIFERAWTANTIEACPRVAELYASVRDLDAKTPVPYQFNGVSAEEIPAREFVRWGSPAPKTTSPPKIVRVKREPDKQSPLPVKQAPQELLPLKVVLVAAAGTVVGIIVLIIFWLLFSLLTR
jgi:serine/threonine protein kinase